MMYKAALFDADGVTLADEGYFTDKLKAQGKLRPEADTDSFFTGVFQDCLSGKTDLKEELAKVIDNWGWQGPVDELIDFWFSVGDDLNKSVAEYIDQLKSRGVACYMATDQEKYRGQYLRGKFSDLFEGFFISNEIGYKKKETEFFEHVYEQVKNKAGNKSDILFVDDGEQNVTNARNFGIDAVHFRSPEDLPALN